MPALDEDAGACGLQVSETPFPPVTRDHILRCSYDYWFPKYRTSCIKSRIIPLPPEFVEYLREDGIILADDDDQDTKEEDEEEWQPSSSANASRPEQDADPDSDSDSDSDSRPARLPPNQRFPVVHQAIKDKILELGGAVVPKLNWSAPKDAAWISRHQNTLKCTTPNDIYLLLKSSSFVSHDLEHAFEGCVPPPPAPSSSLPAATATTPAPDRGFAAQLVLRVFFTMHPALEFRCFVKHRNVVAISPRDPNYYPFLHSLRPAIVVRTRELFEARLRFSFPESCFVFDVYIPNSDSGDSDDERQEREERLGRARLIDINPWAPRTDPLLFDWQELLDLRVPWPVLGAAVGDSERGETEDGGTTDADEEDDDEDEDDFAPELRLVEKDDPAAYNFSSPRYSAHKLPKEVVDASAAGESGMREFAERWNRIMTGRGTDPAQD